MTYYLPPHRNQPFSLYDLCFDLDGTLVDTAPDLIRVTNETIAKVGFEPTVYKLARREVSFGSKVLIENALKRAGHSVPEEQLAELRSFFLKRYEETLSWESRPFQHVMSTLRSLKKGGAKLSVCTNKPGYLARPLLDDLNMTSLFDKIVGGDEAKHAKPSPDHIFQAAGHRKAHRKMIMIGDSYPDIRAGHNAKIPTIFMSYGYTIHNPHKLKPTLILDSFRHIPRALGRL